MTIYSSIMKSYHCLPIIHCSQTQQFSCPKLSHQRYQFDLTQLIKLKSLCMQSVQEMKKTERVDISQPLVRYQHQVLCISMKTTLLTMRSFRIPEQSNSRSIKTATQRPVIMGALISNGSKVTNLHADSMSLSDASMKMKRNGLRNAKKFFFLTVQTKIISFLFISWKETIWNACNSDSQRYHCILNGLLSKYRIKSI